MGVIAPMIDVECDCGETIHTLNAEKEVSLFEKLDVTDKDGLYDEIFSMVYCDDCDGDYECEDRMAQEFIERYNEPQHFSRFKVLIKPDMTIDEL